MVTIQENIAKISIDTIHSPFAFIYAFFKPTIEINQKRYRRPWGNSLFDVPAGDYVISVSYPWILSHECGKSSVRVEVKPGEEKRITYRVGLTRYLPGKITIE